MDPAGQSAGGGAVPGSHEYQTDLRSFLKRSQDVTGSVCRATCAQVTAENN